MYSKFDFQYDFIKYKKSGRKQLQRDLVDITKGLIEGAHQVSAR